MPKRDIEDFIKHWAAASPSERANSQLFLAELCDLLEVPRPDNQPHAGYFFEYPVTEHHADGTTTQGRIDLYKRACFVLESKQFQEARAEATELELAAEEAGVVARKKSSQPVRGTGAWDDAMIKARGQAERYVRALPDDNPPFVVVVDVGHTFEIFADFTQAGKAYLPFPDPRTFRIRLADLADAKIRHRLRLIWTDPAALDPARVSADVTREVSAHLAELAKSLEQAGHKPEVVAQFLTRCLFCMFAEDVELLPKDSFRELLESIPADGAGFEQLVQQLFREMNTGTGKGISVVLRKKLLHFNGGLFADDTVLPVNGLQLGLLKNAARQHWASVEPAIFGTLLERALNPEERHKLGAHFTPRAYVERLVLPTVIEPLRAEWANVRAAAVTHARNGDLKKARAVVNEFHSKLCNLKVLDPACGTGNFLYVALQQLKVLEGEVLDLAAQFGENFKLELETHTVDPHQFLGLEINPRAASIAELVLWIGYLQWHFKLHGKATPPEPILRAFKNIQCRDAVLAYDGEPQPVRDAAGKEITVWDRKSIKLDPVTGREVPDETKRLPLLAYTNPRPAEWPAADVIVGNPPFIGKVKLREDLGDGYAETLREAYPAVPESADFVLYWWHKAAELVRTGMARRFGLITTNSLSQTFARRVVQAQLIAQPQLSLAFVIPDHPWVDAVDGAAVRIAMTVGVAGLHAGELLEVTKEQAQDDGSEYLAFNSVRGIISADLTVGANVSATQPLKANYGLANPGVQLSGQGFIVTANDLQGFEAKTRDKLIRRYITGRDLMQEPREQFVLDTFGLSLENLRSSFPDAFQWLNDRVRPERLTNPRESYRRNWWIHAEPRGRFRDALTGLRRFIVTSRTARHRVFQFLDVVFLPESKVLILAFQDAITLGILSSRAHVVFANAAGGWLGVGNDSTYNHSDCLENFPFPLCGIPQKERIGKLAEELDTHRKRVQAQHNLTLTGLYNVLEKLRSGESLNAKEKLIHDKGLVSVLKQLHDDLDAAVFAAYGWPATLTDAEILERLVALNAERAAEEKRGIIHYLRPEYQARGQKDLVLPDREAKPTKKAKAKTAAPKTKTPWPATLPDRVQAVQTALHAANAAVTAADLAKQFSRAKPEAVEEILKTLVTLGRAHQKGRHFTR